MRPLMASYLEDTIEVTTTGTYDEKRAITIDRDGVPIVERDGSETFTKVRNEPVDEDRVVMETLTEVRDERTDEELPVAVETFTRVRNEPVDEERLVGETATAVRNEATDEEAVEVIMPTGDDSVTGVVSF